MTTFKTASPKCIQYLYHWQPFNPERLTKLLRDKEIYCSNPATFNDPWDCKVFFDIDCLSDPKELEKHIQWFGRITEKHDPALSTKEIDRWKDCCRKNPSLFIEEMKQFSTEMGSAIDQQYRVYCLGQDVYNTLMWAHYADAHQGLCLEFSTSNHVMCCALGVEYKREIPNIAAYSDDDDTNLIPLLTKSEVWSYEQEYRLVPQEYRLVAQEDQIKTEHDTLITNNKYLKLPDGALTSIILGCLGCQRQREEVQELVQKHSPETRVRQAVRLENCYELRIDD